MKNFFYRSKYFLDYNLILIMKLIKWNWIWEIWNWKIWNKKWTFYMDNFYWIDTRWEISFIFRNHHHWYKNKNYEVHVGIEDRWEYYCCQSHLRCNSRKSFLRFIRKRIIPIEHTLQKWTIIELCGRYVDQQSLFYITK